ncbi:Protein dead ringer, partial [Orchesella cincta]
MAKQVLDLYELYNLVIARGGLVDVINKKLWQEIIKGLRLPSSITSAAFTLRTQYMKYLYPYECETRRLSTPAELQAAIDGNRREGRRASYSPYGPEMISPLSLVGGRPQMNGNGTPNPMHPASMFFTNFYDFALTNLKCECEVSGEDEEKYFSKTPVD